MPYRQVTVTTDVTQIAPYHGHRKALAVMNNGAGDIFVSHDPSDVLTRGLRVPAGVVITMTIVDGDETFLALYGQAPVASQDVRVSEGYGLPGGE